MCPFPNKPHLLKKIQLVFETGQNQSVFFIKKAQIDNNLQLANSSDFVIVLTVVYPKFQMYFLTLICFLL
jgi:hypothetical protein